MEYEKKRCCIVFHQYFCYELHYIFKQNKYMFINRNIILIETYLLVNGILSQENIFFINKPHSLNWIFLITLV